jgi:hypothetical protein
MWHDLFQSRADLAAEMTNNTTGAQWSGSFKYASSLLSAEWIKEAPYSGGVLPLADFDISALVRARPMAHTRRFQSRKTAFRWWTRGTRRRTRRTPIARPILTCAGATKPLRPANNPRAPFSLILSATSGVGP